MARRTAANITNISNSNGTLLATYCPSVPDAGTAPIDNGITEAFDATTHAKTASVSGTGWSDPTGAWISAGAVPGPGILVSTATGATV